jgi:hypothetical protein
MAQQMLHGCPYWEGPGRLREGRMLSDHSNQVNETLLSIAATMRGLVDASIRDGMLRAVPDPVEARQLADVHARLLHRIRAMEVALREFDADLRRADELFERAERRMNGPTFLVEVVEEADLIPQ